MTTIPIPVLLTPQKAADIGFKANRVMNKKYAGAILITLFVGLVWFAANYPNPFAHPECGSQAEQDAVIWIVKHPKSKNGNSLFRKAFQTWLNARNTQDVSIDLAWQHASNSAIYTLNTIRMTAKDHDTNAVACEADLNVQIDNINEQTEIQYTVEETTDKQFLTRLRGMME